MTDPLDLTGRLKRMTVYTHTAKMTTLYINHSTRYLPIEVQIGIMPTRNGPSLVRGGISIIICHHRCRKTIPSSVSRRRMVACN